jgi:hypothetical protein
MSKPAAKVAMNKPLAGLHHNYGLIKHNLLNGKQNWTHARTLAEKEKALLEREKAVANSRIIQSRQQARNPAEVEAERGKRLQQLRRSFVRWFPTPRRWTQQGLQKSGKLHVRARRPIPSSPVHRLPRPRQNKSDPLLTARYEGGHSAPLIQKAD